mmetsp:Transcript_41366/g.54381  ORF Transcript_41366/g.54381 Transcript_41366/m.54381 type:complete len:1602 (+) Transcript_41366:199-5004(+)|eukprot:CAMPEP_0117746412 /NCGR_PEP_ID=MMETSP0947-20121206/7930_1 /TAXON_ID=44440 /ORGANISM="Chattonella subsalsa, Strain CCMP2191" /LENGTH=1601 /DNA_ID=CAMNT_0005563729 /DNA_START=169 /DNA_END=4974 /DNA_ORIENTATION=-
MEGKSIRKLDRQNCLKSFRVNQGKTLYGADLIFTKEGSEDYSGVEQNENAILSPIFGSPDEDYIAIDQEEKYLSHFFSSGHHKGNNASYKSPNKKKTGKQGTSKRDLKMKRSYGLNSINIAAKRASSPASLSASSSTSSLFSSSRCSEKWRDMGKNQKNVDRATDVMKRCKRRKKKRLSLNNLSLTEIPTATGIGQFTQLQVLDLQRNQLAFLPEEILNLQNLKTLNLQKNKLRVLFPSAVEGWSLRSLENLDLSHNYLGQGNADADDSPHESDLLSSSQCFGMGVKLPSLRRLNLSDNLMCSFPNEICKNFRRSLHELDVSHNALQEIPDCIEQLQNLEQLLLGDNNLCSLPVGITTLGRLKLLKTDRNALVCPPPEICDAGMEAISRYFSALQTNDEDFLAEENTIDTTSVGAGIPDSKGLPNSPALSILPIKRHLSEADKSAVRNAVQIPRQLKLIFVGAEKSGKTSAVHCLTRGHPSRIADKGRSIGADVVVWSPCPDITRCPSSNQLYQESASSIPSRRRSCSAPFSKVSAFSSLLDSESRSAALNRRRSCSDGTVSRTSLESELYSPRRRRSSSGIISLFSRRVSLDSDELDVVFEADLNNGNYTSQLDEIFQPSSALDHGPFCMDDMLPFEKASDIHFGSFFAADPEYEDTGQSELEDEKEIHFGTFNLPVPGPVENWNGLKVESMETFTRTGEFNTSHPFLQDHTPPSPCNLVSVTEYCRQSTSCSHFEDEEELITFNIWDFAGQDAYHATQELFFSNHALYVLCWDCRYYEDADVDARVQFWIDCIQTRAPGALIQILATHDDLVEEKELKERFQKLLMRLDQHEVWRKEDIEAGLYSCCSSDAPALENLLHQRPVVLREILAVDSRQCHGFEQVRQRLQEVVKGLQGHAPLMPDPMIPRPWESVGRVIYQLTRKMKDKKVPPVVQVRDVVDACRTQCSTPRQYVGIGTVVDALTFYSHMGSIIFFPQTKSDETTKEAHSSGFHGSDEHNLGSWVFLCPMWLFGVLKCLLRHDLREELQRIRLGEGSCRPLSSAPLIPHPLVSHLLSPLVRPSQTAERPPPALSKKEQDLENFLCELLVNFNILARIDISEEYFVPCLLKDTPPNIIHTLSMDEARLGRHFKFHRFVPPSLMPLILTKFLQHNPNRNQENALLVQDSPESPSKASFENMPLAMAQITTDSKEFQVLDYRIGAWKRGFLLCSVNAPWKEVYLELGEDQLLTMWGQAKLNPETVYKLALFMESLVEIINQVVAIFPGCQVDRLITCPLCVLAKPRGPESSWGDFNQEDVKAVQEKGEKGIRCLVNGCMVPLSFLVPQPDQEQFEKGTHFLEDLTPTTPDLYPAVCLVALHDRINPKFTRGGSGFFVKKGNKYFVLTAAHCIIDPSTRRYYNHVSVQKGDAVIKIGILEDGQEYPSWKFTAEPLTGPTKMGEKDFLDILVLQIVGTIKQQAPGLRVKSTPQNKPIRSRAGEIKGGERFRLRTLSLGDSNLVEIDENVRLMGYPGFPRGSLCVARGRVMQHFYSKGFTYIIADIYNDFGSSGGPAINSSGQVIGILSKGVHRKAYILPINMATKLVHDAQQCSHASILYETHSVLH